MARTTLSGLVAPEPPANYSGSASVQQKMMSGPSVSQNIMPATVQQNLMAGPSILQNIMPTTAQQNLMAGPSVSQNIMPTTAQQNLMAEPRVPQNFIPTNYPYPLSTAQVELGRYLQAISNGTPIILANAMLLPQGMQVPQSYMNAQGNMPGSRLPCMYHGAQAQGSNYSFPQQNSTTFTSPQSVDAFRKPESMYQWY
jgi:hypothetical protein